MAEEHDKICQSNVNVMLSPDPRLTSGIPHWLAAPESIRTVTAAAKSRLRCRERQHEGVGFVGPKPPELQAKTVSGDLAHDGRQA